jgi:TatD DNase family protein
MPHPEEFIRQQEQEGNIIIGMTNLPSHYTIGRPYINGFKHIRLALGYHPLYAANHREQVPLFISQSKTTSYIGEIGLDFSKDGIGIKEEQIHLLVDILSNVDTKKKLLSVHSRSAEREVLDCLKNFKVKNVIFHWYSGPIKLIPEIINQGYYFSVNESMILSKKGQTIIGHISTDRILTETDAPYNKHCSLIKINEYLISRKVDVRKNFDTLINKIR